MSTSSQKNWRNVQRVTQRPLLGYLLVVWEGAILGPPAAGVTDFRGNLAREARLSICLFVGLSVGMEGGVAHGRVPDWGRDGEGCCWEEGVLWSPTHQS